MSRPTILRAFFTACALTLILAFAAPARAGDETKEDSAAARLFRDAWWAETGAGALDKAASGYREAIAAKGSEAIRARALYRLALVLQRMGRVEEGVRTLERLAKEFPQETLLLTKARARLDEWTAEDLRESFGDWYRRYQYSPEFQAKIVDLVLKLGTPEHKVQLATKQELLTIGEPAIAALQQHAGSANSSMSRAVVDILVKLGRLPPASTLFASTGWTAQGSFWTLVHQADETTRAALASAAAAHPDDYRAAMMAAMLAGPEAVVKHARTAQVNANSLVYGLLAPWLNDKPDAKLTGALRVMVMDTTVDRYVRATLAKRLLGSTDHDFSGGEAHPLGVTEADLIAWSGSDQRELQKLAWGSMRLARVASPAALESVVAAIGTQGFSGEALKEMSGALFGVLRRMPADADLTAAVKATITLLETTRLSNLDTYPLRNLGAEGRGSQAVPMAVLARAIGRVKSRVARDAPKEWFYRTERGAAAVAQLVAWAQGAAASSLQAEAMRLAGESVSGDTVDLTAPLADESARKQLGEALMHGLQRNKRLTGLGWEEESLLRLIEAARASPTYVRGHTSTILRVGGRSFRVTTRYRNPASDVLATLLHDEEVGAVFRRAAASQPGRFPADLWTLLGSDWKGVERNRKRALRLLADGWASWKPDQRGVGLATLLVPDLVARGDEELDGLLRGFLATGGNTPAVRSHLLEWLPKLTLADVKAAFDLSKTSEVDAAASLLGQLPKTQAVYDAFVSALRPDGPVFVEVYSAFDGNFEPVARDLITRLLAHKDPEANEYGTDILIRRNLAGDMPHWIGALTHPTATVRVLAAKRLGRLYNKAAIKALARAVDDADPEVRDAAIAALERIEKTEKQKERWRKFAGDR